MDNVSVLVASAGPYQFACVVEHAVHVAGIKAVNDKLRVFELFAHPECVREARSFLILGYHHDEPAMFFAPLQYTPVVLA